MRSLPSPGAGVRVTATRGAVRRAALAACLLPSVALGSAACSSDAPDGAAGPGGNGATSIPGTASVPGTTSTPDNNATPSAPGSISADRSDPRGGRELPDVDADPNGDKLPNLAPPKSPVPVATTPWPDAASASGSLVSGFPAALEPLAGSTVVSSSLAPGGERLQVALEATTPRSGTSVLRAYRKRLARHQMVEEPAAAVAGSRAATFRRDGTSLVVTVRREGRRTAYTVFGVVQATKG